MTTKGPSSDTLQLRRGTATEWTTADPVLSAGEVGWERNTNKVKIGDGATAWTSLPYLAGTGVGVDHAVLSGLGDDDHPQYAALAQDEDVTGDWTFSGATVSVGDGTYIHGNVAGNGVRFTNAANSLFTVIIDETGTLLLPVTGGNGGLVIGGDAHLWRNAAGVFKTDANLIIDGDLTAGFTTVDYLEIVEPGATDFAFDTYVVGDTQVRFIMDASGKMAWGPGNTPSDTNLFRSAAGTLKTESTLIVDDDAYFTGTVRGYGRVQAGYDEVKMGLVGTGSTPGLLFGTLEDVNLYRASANRLSTDDELRIFGAATTTPAFSTQVTGEGDARHYVQIDGKHFWGNTASWDTNLYRSAADTLKTDDNFWAVGSGSVALGPASPPPGTNAIVELADNSTSTMLAFTRQESDAGIDTIYRRSLDSGADLVSGNDISRWFFAGRNQGAYGFPAAYAASIGALVDTTPGTTYLPGRLTFSTAAASGSDGPVERLRIDSAGKLWFDGGVGLDTNLYRSAANTLKTDDSFLAVGTVFTQSQFNHLESAGNGTALINFQRTADSVQRFRIEDGGPGGEAGAQLKWGPGGGTAMDINLYRLQADFLKTDDSFLAAGYVSGAHGGTQEVHIGARGPSSEASVTFGNTEDVNLYRSAANTLKTDDEFQSAGAVKAASYLYAYGERIAIGEWPAGFAGIAFGLSSDTNLYRRAADVLKTDDELEVAGGDVYVQSLTGGVTIGGDTRIYRGAADVLKTDDGFIVAGVAGFTATGGPVALGTTTANDVRTPFVQSPDTTAAYLDLQNATNSVLVQNRTDATYVPLRTRGMAAQSGYLQSWENSTPATLAAITATGALDMVEQAAPAAPAADTGRVFFQDDGSGKTQAAIRFPSGASQIIATEP